MHEKADKPRDNNSKAVANNVGQKKSFGKQNFGFVDNRPEAIAQKKIIDRSAQPTQLRQIHEATSMAGLKLEDTNHKFSVIDEVSKSNAYLYRGTEDTTDTDNKGEALATLAARAGQTASKIKNVVGKNYTRSAADMDKSDINSIDPFSHGHVQEYGTDDYICLIYQQSSGFDGYVNGIEEGKVGDLGTYAQNFQKSMSRGKKRKKVSATMDGIEAQDGNYSNLHEQNINTSLLAVASGDTEGKADAITKLAGEGARFVWVRDNIATITDSTTFNIGVTRHGTASITFNNLWCVWKSWFDGAYNISEQQQRKTLEQQADAKKLSKEAKKRIDFTNTSSE